MNLSDYRRLVRVGWIGFLLLLSFFGACALYGWLYRHHGTTATVVLADGPSTPSDQFMVVAFPRPMPADERLREANRTAKLIARQAKFDQLARRFDSEDAGRRLVGLMAAQERIARGDEDRAWIGRVAGMLKDVDEDCRWQAGILLGLLIAHEPEKVWELAKEFGQSDDQSVRTIVATTLLEHLLDHDPRRFEPLTRALSASSRNFRDTFRRTWQGTEELKDAAEA